MKLMLLFLSALVMIPAQTLSIGVKGGIPFNDATRDFGSHDESRPYTVGPTVEITLPAHFALEADALYQRVGNSQSFSLTPATVTAIISQSPPAGTTILSSYSQRLRGNSWEFPLIGKYYFGTHLAHWQPYAGLGFAFRTVGYRTATSQNTVSVPGLTVAATSFNNNFRGELGVGAVAAVGARLHVGGHLSLAPEVRYTRWGSADGRLANNEARLLLGLTF